MVTSELAGLTETEAFPKESKLTIWDASPLKEYVTDALAVPERVNTALPPEQIGEVTGLRELKTGKTAVFPTVIDLESVHNETKSVIVTE